jgi:hypothetical protein
MTGGSTHGGQLGEPHVAALAVDAARGYRRSRGGGGAPGRVGTRARGCGLPLRGAGAGPQRRRRPWPPWPMGLGGPGRPGRRGRVGSVRVEPTGSAQVEKDMFLFFTFLKSFLVQKQFQ